MKEELEKLKIDYAKFYGMPEMVFQDEHFFMLARMFHANLSHLKRVQNDFLKEFDSRMKKMEEQELEVNTRQQKILNDLARNNSSSNLKMEKSIELFDKLLKERITLKTYSFDNPETAKAYVKEQSLQRILTIVFIAIFVFFLYSIIQYLTR